MEPAISIMSYLWDNRNSEWFKHNDQCECPFEVKAEQLLDSIPVSLYAEIVEVNDQPVFALLQHTADEWDRLIGPIARAEALEKHAEALMDRAAEYIAAAASTTRLNDE